MPCFRDAAFTRWLRQKGATETGYIHDRFSTPPSASPQNRAPKTDLTPPRHLTRILDHMTAAAGPDRSV
jgi:hypothetical protein